MTTTALGQYRWQANAEVDNPGVGSLALDEPVSAMSVAAVNDDDVDNTEALALIAADDVLVMTHAIDVGRWGAFTVRLAPLSYAPEGNNPNLGDWFAIPVAFSHAGMQAAPSSGDTINLTHVPADDVPLTWPTFGQETTLRTTPVAHPPTGTQLATWLSITATDAATLALLDGCCTVATQYELGRLSVERMREAGYMPPDTLPGAVAQAMLMRAAAMYRRRNSVNGFEGFADLGAVAIRASDPDIERLVDPWRAWAFA